jgi:hypothetical protein
LRGEERSSCRHVKSKLVVPALRPAETSPLTPWIEEVDGIFSRLGVMRILGIFFASLAACGGTAPPSVAPAGVGAIPEASGSDAENDRPYPDVALSLLAGATPFTRGYLRGRLDELTWGEEVLLVRFRGPQKGGIIVGSNLGTYDVLRWDGACSRAVDAEMITRIKPASPKVARIRWHRLGVRTQDSLVSASEAIRRARTTRGKECKGAMTGEVSAACDKADDSLTNAVVDYVRAGGALPPPDDVP